MRPDRRADDGRGGKPGMNMRRLLLAAAGVVLDGIVGTGASGALMGICAGLGAVFACIGWTLRR